MRSHAKASSAGSTEGNGEGRGLFRRAFAIRGDLDTSEGSGARPLGVIVGLLAMLAAALLVAPSAQAAGPPTYYPHGSFAKDQFFGLTRLAVEPGTGNILALNGSSIKVFSPDPSLGTQLTTIPVTGIPAAVGTDPLNGAVYYGDNETGTITRFLSDGAPTPTYTADATFVGPTLGSGAGQVGSISGISVDPTTHDVLVVDPTNGLVDRFSPSGAFLSSFDGAASPTSGFAGATDIAVGPAGDIYVAVAGQVDRFTSAGVANGGLTFGGHADYLAVDQKSGRIAAAGDGQEFNEVTPNLYLFDSAGILLSKTRYPTELFPFGGLGTAIAIDSAAARLYSSEIDPFNPAATAIQVFDAGVSPGVEISPASLIEAHSAHLDGTVDSGQDGTLPESRLAGTAHFVLEAKGQTLETSPQSYAGTEGNQTISADVPDLQPNTTYSVRLVAENSLAEAESASLTFKTAATPPTVVTGDATEVARDSAVLRGTITAFGDPTTYHFEYGPTITYGSRIPVGHEAIASAGYAPFSVSQMIGSLQPGTTYHYRLVAQNSTGTEAGVDRTFMTPTSGAGFPDRAYELVATGQPTSTVVDLGAMAKSSGDGLMFTSANAANSPITQTAPRYARYASVRGPGGWTVTPLDPRTAGEQSYFTYATLAVSEDLSHALVTSDLALAPGAYEGGGNLYIRDVQSGGLTFVGGNPSHFAFTAYVSNSNADKVLGGTSDFGVVVFNSAYTLTPNATPGVLNTYEWSEANGLRLVSVLPDGDPATVSSQLGAIEGSEIYRVSEEGSVIGFSLNGVGVYARVDGNATVPLSVSQVPGDPSGPHPGYVGAVGGDGRYVVFTSTDDVPLTVDAPVGLENLYRYDNSTGNLEYLGGAGSVFVASRDAKGIYFFEGGRLKLSEDGQVRDVGPQLNLVFLARMVSPNGRYLLVNAPGSTAPDENAGGPLQIFIYDTQTDEWSCASCLPSGAGGGSLPLNKREFFNNRQVRAVTDSGEAFFTSQARLTSQDVNGNEDVYAYKDGALKLISPGTAPYNATFMDAGADGSDVYFKTEQRLTPGADKIGYSVYDARVGGGFPEELSPPPCQGEACQAASAAPLLSEPSVASGANQRARKKSRCRAPMKAKSSAKAKKKEQHCGKTRKHRGKAKAKRAGSSRRAGR